MRTEVVAQLEELGLSRNAALAYVTLLEEAGSDGATGYEVAARSGVPRSAVYGVLSRLEDLGAAFSLGEKPVRYVATSPGQLVDHLRRTAEARFGRVIDTLSQIPQRPRPEPIWSLSRYEEVVERIDTMIRGARQSVYLSLWTREIDVLVSAFKSAADRAIHRVLHSPDGAVPVEGFSCWFDDLTGDEQKKAWSHKALVVVDRREALIGGTEMHLENHAVWTTNPSLVDVATNHIILDITRLANASGRSCVGDVGPMMRPHLDRAYSE